MRQKYYKEDIMLDAYIIDFIKEEEKKRQGDGARIPLYIYPPGFDEYRDDSHKPDDTNKKRYIEIDIAGDDKDDSNIIKM